MLLSTGQCLLVLVNAWQSMMELSVLRVRAVIALSRYSKKGFSIEGPGRYDHRRNSHRRNSCI